MPKNDPFKMPKMPEYLPFRGPGFALDIPMDCDYVLFIPPTHHLADHAGEKLSVRIEVEKHLGEGSPGIMMNPKALLEQTSCLEGGESQSSINRWIMNDREMEAYRILGRCQYVLDEASRLLIERFETKGHISYMLEAQSKEINEFVNGTKKDWDDEVLETGDS